jgi:hypothetical protein
VTRVGETAMLDAFARFAELRPDWADWRIQIEVRMASLEVPLVGPPGGGKPGRYVAHIGLMGPGTPRWNQDRQEYERSAGPEVCAWEVPQEAVVVVVDAITAMFAEAEVCALARAGAPDWQGNVQRWVWERAHAR